MTIKKHVFALFAGMLMLSTAHAGVDDESELQTLRFSSMQNFAYGTQPPYEPPHGVDVVLVLDPISPGQHSPSSFEYQNAVKQLVFAFLDEEGRQIEQGITNWYDESNVDHTSLRGYWESDRVYFTAALYLKDGATFLLQLYGPNKDALFATTRGFPVLQEIAAEDSSIILKLEKMNHYTYDFGSTQVGYYGLVEDSDNDGVADADDRCEASLLDETVVFDGVNSGVTNHLDAQGCSIMDHYASCETEQSARGFLGYRGPTQCEMLMGYQLYREGLIDYTELRMLRNAL